MAILAILGTGVADPVAAETRPAPPPTERVLPVRLRWTVDVDGEPVAAPVADGHRVYLVLGDGRVTAFARADGTRLWTREVAARDVVALTRDALIVATAHGVAALAAGDGTPLWTASSEAPAAAPVAAGGWVVYGTARGELFALRDEDGTVVWRQALDAPPAGRAAIAGDGVYVPLGDGRVVRMVLASGHLEWQRRLDGRPDGVRVAGDRVLTGASDNFLYCLAARDGRVLWRMRTAADIVAAPAVDAQHIYFVSLDNLLRALDRRSGSLRWARLLEGRHLGEPQVAAGLVVAGVPQPVVLFYAAATGRPVAGLNLPAPLLVAPSRVEPGPLGAHFFVATIDAAGAVHLSAVAPGEDPPLAPLGELPGRPLEIEPNPVKGGSEKLRLG